MSIPKAVTLSGILMLGLVEIAPTPAAAAQMPTRVTADLSASTTAYGGSVRFTGQVDPSNTSDRTVRLYRVESDGSQVFVRKRPVSQDGRYSIPLSTDRLGTSDWQVQTPATERASSGWSASRRLTVQRATSRLSAHWSGTRSTLYQRSAVSGRVSATAGHQRRVQAEMWLPGGWYPVARGWTDRAGRYSLALPTFWYHNKRVRVLAPGTEGATPAVTATVTQAVTPSYPPLGSARDWRPLSQDRMRWNPCRVITWRFNGERAPRGALADTRQALRRVSQATGMRFRFVGGSRVIPGTTNRWPTDTAIIVAFARPSESRWDLRGHVVGRGGPIELMPGEDGHGSVWRIIRGGVVIDATAGLRGGFGVDEDRGRVLMHEIGHVLGLHHAAHNSQLMFAVIDSSLRARWGAGDLTGLRTLGLGSGCVGTPKNSRFAVPVSAAQPLP